MLDLTIIIVSYNSEHLISRTLDSLPPCSSVIVVDNASTDSTCSIVSSCGLSHVRLIRNSSNVGFGAANNIALRECRTRYALLLNPDAKISADNLEHLIKALESDSQAVMAGPRILKSDKDKKRKHHKVPLHPMLHKERPLFCARLQFWKRRSLYITDFTRIYDTGCLVGSILLYDLNKMPEILYFDDDIFLYGDEDELEYRIIRDGYRLLYVPYAIGHHIGQGSTHTLDTEAKKLWNRSYYRGESLGILSAKYKTSSVLRNLHLCILLLKQIIYFWKGKSLGYKAERQGIMAGYRKIRNR